MEILFLIPARGGSKGIPGKNIKPLNGKPLICYAIDAARELTTNDNICISTDDLEIKNVCEQYGLQVPFLRPASLATDTVGSYDVVTHAFNYYKTQGKKYDTIVLLQPTSPLRKGTHIKEAIAKYATSVDMVVSVKETRANPYYLLYEDNDEGYLVKSKKLEITRRQDCPKVWELNGAIYVINCNSLIENTSFAGFKKLSKYVMDEYTSVDIDTPIDWMLAEQIIKMNDK